MARGPAYGILRKIATGGMAELYLAESPSGQRVALKRILPQFASDREFVQMFLDEARIAATLQHPNIVRMMEVGSDAGAYFIVMEFLDGENLRTLMRQLRSLGRPLPIEQALAILIGTAAGLHHAHEQLGTDGRPLRIVHRDVSPQNILVTHDGAVKLVDFGIAKAASRSTETRAGTMKGKVPYMSPEQCNGEALDRRSDIWSLGAVMYELTVGRRLIRRAPDYLMMKQITEEPVTPPSQLLPMYPLELERVLLKALARRRGQRYQTMADLRDDLVAFASSSRYDLSPVPLAAMMREAFGTETPSSASRVDDEEPPPTEEEPPPSAALPEVKPRAVAVTWVPGPDNPARRAESPRAPGVSRRRVGNVEIVSVVGRLSESFQGAELGASLHGDVVLDLGQVERVTSFGVREWLAMNQAAKTSSLYLANCTEPIVNQLTMIRGFAGPGVVLSFRAPYVCTSCRTPFQRLVDAEADASAVRAQVPPAASCPKCGADGSFDDDPRTYFAIAGLLAVSVPPSIRAATGPVDLSGRPPIEKSVDAAGTILAVHGALTPALRWRPALEGAEGELRIELGGVSSVQADGIRPLITALRAVKHDVRQVTLVGCPRELVDDLAVEPWLQVRSWQGSDPAPTPTAALPAEVRPPSLPPEPLAPAEAAAPVSEPPAEEEENRVASWFVGLGLVGASALVVVLGLLVGGAAGLWAVVGPGAEPVVVAPAPLPSEPWVVGQQTVSVVGYGVGPTAELAVASARQDALTRVVAELRRASGRPATAPLDPAEAVARYEAAYGAIATPERRDADPQPGPNGVTVRGTWELKRPAWDEVLRRSAVLRANGLELAPVLPDEPGDGLIVLASQDPEIAVGARVVAIDGAALHPGDPVGDLRGRLLTVRTDVGERSVRLP